MEFQIHDWWCVIAILKNIFSNNIINNKDLKEMEQEEIASFFPNNANDGASLSKVIEILNTNPIIQENLGFNLKKIDLTRLFWNRLNDIEKRMWIRHLIWESLSRQSPVMFGGLFDDDEYDDEGCDSSYHAALIVGIKPNKENILEDTYYVRDPWRDSEAEFIPDQTTEISMTGEQIFNILFNQIENGIVLIHEDVFQLFCKKAISIFSSIWEMAEPELIAAIVIVELKYKKNIKSFKFNHFNLNKYNKFSCL